jgi:hypothetical protein
VDPEQKRVRTVSLEKQEEESLVGEPPGERLLWSPPLLRPLRSHSRPVATERNQVANGVAADLAVDDRLLLPAFLRKELHPDSLPAIGASHPIIGFHISQLAFIFGGGARPYRLGF